VAFVETPPARRRDSKGGGETPQKNNTTTNCAMQQFISEGPGQPGLPICFPDDNNQITRYSAVQQYAINSLRGGFTAEK
jgi:hypothetical protein